MRKRELIIIFLLALSVLLVSFVSASNSITCRGDTWIMGCDVSMNQASCESTCSPELNKACVWTGSSCVADESYCDVPCLGQGSSGGSSGDSGSSGSSSSSGGDSGFGDQSIRVKMYLDPDYTAKTEKERGFRPSEPFTPFDDVVCELRLPSGESMQNYGGQLFYKKNGKFKEIKSGTFNFDRSDSDGYKYFTMKIGGWPNGWTDNPSMMEEVIESKEVYCYAETNSLGGVISDPYTISTCVHLWGENSNELGDAEIDKRIFGLVYMRGESSKMSAKDMINTGEYNRKESFEKVDPFKTYSKKFAHYVDLTNLPDTKWDTYGRDVFKLDPATNKIIKTDEKIKFLVPPHLVSDSSCGYDKEFYVFYSAIPSNSATQFGSRQIIMSTRFIPSVIDTLIEQAKTTILIHELGHAFCRLFDEYDPIFSYEEKPIGGINCIKDSSKYGLYGDRGQVGCVLSFNFFRPSDKSIMGGSQRYDPRFNVIDAGNCIGAVKGHSKDNFREACTLDTIRPVGNENCDKLIACGDGKVEGLEECDCGVAGSSGSQGQAGTSGCKFALGIDTTSTCSECKSCPKSFTLSAFYDFEQIASAAATPRFNEGDQVFSQVFKKLYFNGEFTNDKTIPIKGTFSVQITSIRKSDLTPTQIELVDTDRSVYLTKFIKQIYDALGRTSSGSEVARQVSDWGCRNRGNYISTDVYPREIIDACKKYESEKTDYTFTYDFEAKTLTISGGGAITGQGQFKVENVPYSEFKNLVSNMNYIAEDKPSWPTLKLNIARTWNYNFDKPGIISPSDFMSKLRKVLYECNLL